MEMRRALATSSGRLPSCPLPGRPRVRASWSQIGAALGTSKQAAWEAHCRWIDDQAEQHRRRGYEGLADADVAAARTLAGPPDPADPGPR
jgi:hypothetical protein